VGAAASPSREGASVDALLAVRRHEEFSKQFDRLLYGDAPKPPYVPVVSEVSYGVLGTDVVAAAHRFATQGPPIRPLPGTSTAPGPRIAGLTLPELRQAEREARWQAAVEERFRGVWTRLT
jgi:hypothetical protein